MHNDNFLSNSVLFSSQKNHTMGFDFEPGTVCMLYAKHKLYNEIATQNHVLCFVNSNAFWFDFLLANAVPFLNV